jgi:large subunit ribosomal protein L3
MKKFLLGRKIGMTQLIEEDSRVTPVTVVQVEPCSVLKVKTVAKDGYDSVQVGYGKAKEKKCNKAHQGIFKKLNAELKAGIKEFRVSDVTKFKVGDEILPDVFAPNEEIIVRGKTIGKGFAGTIKRWNFSRGPMTHGSKSHRIPGSSGSGTTPGNVFKGKRRAGHLGDEFISIKGLKVVKVNKEKMLIFIKGAIPGKRNNLVEIFN